MKLLHNLTGLSKIFKYQDFTETGPETAADDLPVQEAPYLTFEEEDLRKPAEEEALVQLTAEGAGEEAEAAREVIPSEAEAIINQARQEAEGILEEARAEAARQLDAVREAAGQMQASAQEEGYRQGYDHGFSQGQQAGEEQLLAAANEKYKRFFRTVEAACDGIDTQKKEILEQHLKDLSELTLTIAEKVIHVALESCGEVIKRMILSAAAPALDKAWAKVMISAKDAEMMKEDGINIKQALSEISDRIDLVIVEDAPQGTCLVEFPDQAVDAGASTQMKNLKTVVRNAEKE